jgi:hypothetical protein
MTPDPERFTARVRCPSCNVAADVLVEYSSRLVMDDDDSIIRLRIKQRPARHLCHQLRLDDDQDHGGGDQLRLPDARERAAGGLDD